MLYNLTKTIWPLKGLSEDEKEQDKRDLKALQEKVKKLNWKAKQTANCLRRAAYKLDQVWRECRKVNAAGTASGFLGGLLTIGAGIATISTSGVALPLLLAGMGLGVGSTFTNVGTTFIEDAINSVEIKKAETISRETLDNMTDVNNIINGWLHTKKKASLLYIYYLATNLNLGDPVINLLGKIIFGLPANVSEVKEELAVEVDHEAYVPVNELPRVFTDSAVPFVAQGREAALNAACQIVGRAVTQAGGKGAARACIQADACTNDAVGSVAVNAIFLMQDAIDLGCTISALVQNKGSDAAKLLREKADALENLLY